jgi:hypothetical protein
MAIKMHAVAQLQAGLQVSHCIHTGEHCASNNSLQVRTGLLLYLEGTLVCTCARHDKSTNCSAQLPEQWFEHHTTTALEYPAAPFGSDDCFTTYPHADTLLDYSLEDRELWADGVGERDVLQHQLSNHGVKLTCRGTRQDIEARMN